MSEARSIAARDKIAKMIGLTSVKANVVLREIGRDRGNEIVIMCASEDIKKGCEKIVPKIIDGHPVSVTLRPQPGTTKGLRVNMAYGRITLPDK